MTFASKVNPQFDRYDRPYMLAVVVGLLTLVGLCFSLILNDTFDNCTLLPGEVSRLFTTDKDREIFFAENVLNDGSTACIDHMFNFRINDNHQLFAVACAIGTEEDLAQSMISFGVNPEDFKWCPGKFQENELLLLQALQTYDRLGCGDVHWGYELPEGQFTPFLMNLKTKTKVCENRFTAITAAFGFMPMIMRCATFLGAGILIMSRCVKPMNKSGPWYDRFSDLNTSHVVEILELQGKVADLNDTQKRMLAKLEMKLVGDEKFVDNKEV
mmetsp:Transcript_31887/g.38021  ORF Transcript_31887/g.38021 Transcript_31887/m.38021 type:complete len:271 (+) Transcript_31887:143-955(+)